MNEFNNLIKNIKNNLQQNLPGYDAQKLMEPANKKHSIEKNNYISPKTSSILILIYPKNNKAHTVFIRRSKYNGVHSQQISFPGGQYEKIDNSLINTAIRETNEEIGINPDDINIIGNLSEIYIPPSNFNVLPVIAYLNKTPVFDIDKNEVDIIIEISIDELLDKKIVCNRKVQNSENKILDVPCYLFNENIIWGATAMIISEFIEVVLQNEKDCKNKNKY